MSCAQPIKIENPNYMRYGSMRFWEKYLEVPCNWCLNCRVDRLNWITDACEYEYRNYDFIGSFVTLTYDDIYINELSNIIPDDFGIVDFDNGNFKTIPYKNNRPVDYSLRRKDFRDFIKRLRSKINYYYKKHNIETLDLCRKNFKFIGSGEYGDLFGRPHYHFVFFGLDYEFCCDLIQDCWHFGFIDVKPIKDGAFRYVAKYFNKQLCGSYAKELYDNNNLERPFFTHSLGFGKGLILQQLDFIKKNNGCYLNNNDVLRPLPIYYRNYFRIRMITDFKNTSNTMLNHCITPDIPYNEKSYIRYSLKKMNEYKHTQALLRHQKLEKQFDNTNSIIPLNDYNFNGNSIIYELVDKAYFLDNKEVINKDFDSFVNFCDKYNIVPF